MNEAQVRTLEQVREVLAGTQSLEIPPLGGEAGCYTWTATAIGPHATHKL